MDGVQINITNFLKISFALCENVVYACGVQDNQVNAFLEKTNWNLKRLKGTKV